MLEDRGGEGIVGGQGRPIEVVNVVFAITSSFVADGGVYLTRRCILQSERVLL
jgi:hypothetical protein